MGNHADTEIKVDGSKKTITLLKQKWLTRQYEAWLYAYTYLSRKRFNDESILNLAIDLDQKKKVWIMKAEQFLQH